MIKRIVGLLAAVAVLAVVVFAILGSGTYSSFIGRAGRSAAAPAASTHAPASRKATSVTSSFLNMASPRQTRKERAKPRSFRSVPVSDPGRPA